MLDYKKHEKMHYYLQKFIFKAFRSSDNISKGRQVYFLINKKEGKLHCEFTD